MAYATDYSTLLTGSYWIGAQQAPMAAQPVILTYSFLTAKPTSDPHGLGAATLNTFAAFTPAQQSQTQNALATWSSVSGVIFEQVAPGKGDINFAAYDLGATGPGGEGFYPWGNWNYSTQTSSTISFGADIQANGYGDVLMNKDYAFSDATLLHEIGHALGLKHPTDAWTLYPFGAVYNQWGPGAYDPNFSIMSPGGSGPGATALTQADKDAIASIYGTYAQQAAQFSSWSWNKTTYTLTATLKDGGQTVRGVSTSNTITGGTGADTIYAIGQGTNYIYGKAGDDTLVGGSGVNYLDGGAGADTLNGWFSVNTYASYADATAPVTVNLVTAVGAGDAAGDVYINIHKVLGSNYADTITGDNSGDVLYGGAGDDTIAGGSGVDHLYGQAGVDTLIAGTGTSYLDGGAGADKLIGSVGHASYAAFTDATAGVAVSLLNGVGTGGDAAGDTYSNIHNAVGSNYADTITGDNSGDMLYGGSGDDTITGGSGVDHLYGQAGADTLIAGTGTSYLDGGAGADTLIGSVGHASYASFTDAKAGVAVDLLNGVGTGGDATGDTYSNIHDVLGSNYADTIAGDNSNDVLYGGAGDDTITGGSGVERLYGQAGADTLIAGTGTNYLDGGAGADTLIGSVGHASYAAYTDATAGVAVNLQSGGTGGDAAGDTYSNIHDVAGSNYADAITGDNFGDVLSGGAGADTIIGGSGRDVLTGGAGADTLTGGLGADQFRFAAPSEGGDTITDFSAAQGDKIYVAASGFGGGLVAGALSSLHFANDAATASTGQFIWAAASGALSWDSDGTGPGAAVLIATLQPGATLGAANIQVY